MKIKLMKKMTIKVTKLMMIKKKKKEIQGTEIKMTKEVMMKTALKMMKIKSQKNQVMMRRRNKT